MKKALTLTLALCLVLSLMGTALADLDPKDYPKFENTVVLTCAKDDGFNFYGENDQWVSPEDNLWLKTMKDYLNVEFEYLWLTQNDAANYETKWNLAMAGDEIPVVAGVNRTVYEALYEAGLIADDMGDYLEKYGSEWVKSFYKGSVEETYMTRDGKLHGVPVVRPSMDQYDTLCVRYDWMKKVGVEEVPTTIEGIIDLGRKFVAAGLGKYVLAVGGAGPWTGWAGLQGFFQGHGVAWASGYWNKGEDGKLFYGMTDPRMKDALMTLQGLYKEGLIKEDFLVSSVAESINKGETGIMYSVSFGPVNTIDLFALDPETDIIAVDVPTLTGEKPQYFVNAVPNSFLFVSKDATPEQKQAIIEVLNLREDLFSDLNSSVDWGYHRNANPFNPANQYEGTFQYSMYYDEIEHAFTTGDLESFVTANGKTYYNRVMNYLNGDATLARYYPIYRVPNGTYSVINTVWKEGRVHNSFYTAPETEFMQENRAMLDELLINAAQQVIMGADISVWEKALNEWHATGGDTMTEEVNEWFEKQ